MSCKDDPEPLPIASFTVNYGSEGEAIFNLSSTYAESYLWDFGDGASSDEKVPKHTYQKNGRYVVTLTVTGPGGKLVLTEFVQIANITGSVVVFLTSTRNRNVEVYIDEVYKGVITGYYSNGDPSCGAIYTVTVNDLPVGTYNLRAREVGLNAREWKGEIPIKEKYCEQVALYY